MATEVEAKLSVSPRALREAARLPWLRKRASGVTTEIIISVYYDTKHFKLRDHGLTLRIRKIGRKHLQTIKADGQSVSGRQEFEEEVDGASPDFKRAKGTPLKPLVTRKLKNALNPVFETRVRRTSVPLRFGKSEIEVAFDQGTIKAGRARTRLSEIELELKSGNRRDLASVVKRLRKEVAVAYGVQTKAERGYALSAGAKDTPVGASAIALDRDATVGEAFAAIGLSCLHHLAANEEAVRRGGAEGVHQMRVGLRRLRAAISVFKSVVQNRETDGVKTQLKWLAGQLGPARDFDVLVNESVTPLRPATPEIRLLEADLKKKRSKGFDRAKVAIESERYRRIVLDTALWLIDGQWSRGAGPHTEQRLRPIAEFASDVFRRRTRKIARKGRKIEELEPLQRHKVRIAVKKLRYATAFFASLFDKPKARKARRPFEKNLKSLQNALGKLNDIAVHRKLAGQYAHPPRQSKKRPQKAFAIGVLTGREKARASVCITVAVEAAAALAKADEFWRY